MTDASIFLFGAVASFVVVIALGLMLWAAIEDGKRQHQSDQKPDLVP